MKEYITEDTYRNLEVSRRTVLQIPIALGISQLLIGCGIQTPEAANKESKIRRAIGEWTKEDIQNLAESMIEETQFGDIVQTGQILLDNLNGKTSFSEMSPLFKNSPLKIVTVNSLATKTGKGTPMTANVKPVEPRIIITLKPRLPDTSDFLTISNLTNLHYEKLTISERHMSNYSDFLFKFYTAKEIFNIKAFGMVAEYMIKPLIEGYSISPDNDDAKRALQLYGLRGGITEMPAEAMVDIWAHFLLVPAYLKAVEQKRFSNGDLRNGGEAINIFKTPAELFQREGILSKNNSGQWEWTKDYNLFIQTWEDVALRGYRVGIMG